MVKGKILFVDDEENILQSMRLNLRKRYSAATALGPMEGIQAIQEKGPFEVVVSDYKMPEMNGIEFLSKVKEKHPDTVRIMLTGQADLDASIKAVNDGAVFRFLTKPCPLETLTAALDAALEQHRLITAERDLLRGTLRGSVRVLTDVLSLVNPEAFGRSERIQRLMTRVAKKRGLLNIWKYELAGMLSQLGCVSVTEEVLRKVYTGQKLNQEEQQIYGMHPSVAASLISNIPRLEDVAEMILHQMDEFDSVPSLPEGARMLKIIIDYDELTQAGGVKNEVIAELKRRTGRYDPAVLESFEYVVFQEEGYLPRSLDLKELKIGMILAADVKTTAGKLLMVEGAEITEATLSRLRTFQSSFGVQQPVHVKVPLPK
jgi:response regulator RpfG family c-di-GMP phosphodiesterase